LRAGTFRSIPLDNLEGLITFPSFHTAGAIMFIWALRKVPYVRWPAIALNAALIAATPIDGAHYFIDLVGGAVVAFAAIAMSYWICRFVPVEETMTVPVPAAVPEAARASV
jgi:membrane-associated phospholipid phosphatase